MKQRTCQPRVGGTSSVAGAVRGGVLAGLFVVLFAGAVLAYLRLSGERLPFERRREVDEVLLIAALPDENGDAVAQVIAKTDLARGTVTSIDPSTTVTIPGTSYSSLRDAYPFGGGDGVARAVATLHAEDPMPWIALGPGAVQRLLEGGARIEVRLEEPMAVFDGERLYEFGAGTVTVANVSDLRAVLNGAGYLPPALRQRMIGDVAAGLVKAVADYPGGVGRAIEAGVFESDLAPEEADSVAKRMAGLRRE